MTASLRRAPDQKRTSTPTQELLSLSLCWPQGYRFTLPATEIITSAPPFNVADDELVANVAAAMDLLRHRQEEQIERLNHPWFLRWGFALAATLFCSRRRVEGSEPGASVERD